MENMRKAQASQKRWYDQNARDRELKFGSKVLVPQTSCSLSGKARM